MSIQATPTFCGSPAGSPVSSMMPPMPWIMKSYPGWLARGPVCPNPVTDA